MDRPLGPRQQPDKRNAAYESIFGRPSASHHHLQPPSSFSQAYSTPPLLGQHLTYQQPYQAQVDRRASFTPSLVPSPQIPVLSNQQLPTNPNFRQSYYLPPQPQAQLPQGLPSSPYPAHHHHHHHHSPPPNLVAPHSDHHGRANSVASTSHSSNIGIIQPPPEEPVQTQNGLTPAQVYRAQVSLNSPNDSQGDWSRFRNSSERQPAPSYQDPPRIGVDLDPDDGKLGIDFGQGSNSSEQSTDDGSSELPWAVQERTSSPPSSKVPLSPRFSIDSDHSSRHPLQVQTNMPSDSAVLSAKTSPTSSTTADYTSILSSSAYVTGRRSSDSARTMPRLMGPRRERGPQDRSMSMSAASLRPTSTSRPPIPNHQGRDSPTSIRLPVRKTPIVYPALLSCVAEAFRERILVGDRVKDGLTYKNSFDGREAVDKIAYIIKTTDRNLALLLGRSLDAQKFFHDVTYDHRLRDSSNELYQFQTRVRSPFTSGELENGVEQGSGDEKNAKPPEDDSGSPSPAGSSTPQIQQQQEGALPSVDEITALPTGVFTLLTDCYSPTCSRDRLCYSIACPRRLEQQARLNMKPQPGLSKQISRESLGDVPDAGTLWIHSVPPEIVNSVSDTEKKRQEAINEVIYTERDFVRDLEYLRDVWINQLKDSDIIAAERRTDFLEQVFWNIHDIIAVNTRLRDALNKRQKSYAVVERIGDILLDAVPHFGPFVSYGAHQLYGKYEFEKEKNSNPAFAQFVEMTERLPESRKLELNAYLTKPTTRLARYPLLLQAVLKHTPEDSPDKIILPKVIALVKEFLGKVNAESGKTENRFNLLQLEQQLFFRPGEEVDLRLKEEGRQLIYKNPLNKRDGEIQVYLFDHALLFAKAVKTKQHEQYKVYRRPIPLELLLISAPEDAANATVRSQNHRNRGLVKRASFNGKVSPNVPAAKSESKGSHWITFMHLGRKYYHLTLWATSAMGQRKWLENIYKQQQVMRERSMIFDTVTLSEGFFSGPTNKVNCAAPFNGGRCVVYGTDDGVYISDLMVNREPVKVLGLLEVAQVDVLEDYQLLIVLSERQVITFPLDALDPNDPVAGLKRAKRISSHTSFFKAGYCLGKVLVCIVKSSQLSSTFKTLEPIDQNIRGRSKPTFRKLLQGGNDTLKMFKEFYIPVESTSIHYLKTKMCVGCSRGFEIVDLESLDTQGLLDPQDESLDFVRKKENLRPMAIYRIGNEFLLCYDEFAFYVNKNGRRSRKDFMVYWEGLPSGFALHEPYVLAFEPSFVEIRHIETGLLSQVIQGNNLRLLFADTPPSVSNNHHYASSVEYGYNPYAASTNSYGSRQSAYNAYGVPPQQMAYPNPNQYPRPPQGVGRDEILIVSDDRVLALRPAAGLHRFMGDNLSQVSIPR